jgi:hypothetical protein
MSAAAYTLRGDRTAEILAAIAVVDVAKIHAAPVLLLSIDGPPTPIVGLHVGGRHFCLSIDETTALAGAVPSVPGIDHAQDLADGLRSITGMLDLMMIKERLRSAREASWWASQ